MAILTDTEKRKQYDLYGPESERAPRTQRETYTRGFETDATAEELFNMFFGGGLGGGFTGSNVFVRRSGGRWQRTSNAAHENRSRREVRKYVMVFIY